MSVWQPKRRYDALLLPIGHPPVKDFQDIKELKKAAAKILNQIKNPVEAIIIPRDENTENMRVCLNMGIGF